MSYTPLPTRTNADLNSASDINQLTANIQAVIDDYIHPIGSIYIQFPDATGTFDNDERPGDLYGGSWSEQFNTEGVFWRTEGDPKLNDGITAIGLETDNRTNGKQNDQFQGLTGYIGRAGSNDANIFRNSGSFNGGGVFKFYSSGTSTYVAKSSTSDSGGGFQFDPTNHADSRASSTTIGETRPINRQFRIWKRTA